MSQFALQMRQISKTFGGVRANDSIDLLVKKGTIHALAGENGAGKSTLMKILFGLVKADPETEIRGGIFVNDNKVKFQSPLDAIRAGIGMVQQHFAIAGALSALDNIILGAEPARRGVIDRVRAETRLDEIAGSHLAVPWNEKADALTVGLQQRMEILKLLYRNADILILDEPTAVLTPQEVEDFFALLKRLRDEGKTTILITHKLHEVLSLSDEVTVLRQGRVTGHFETKDLTKEDLVRAMIGRDIKPVTKAKKNPGETLLHVEKLTVTRPGRGGLQGLHLDLRKNEIVGVAGVEGNGQQALVESLLGLCRYEGTVLYKGAPLPTKTSVVREKLNVGLISEDRHEQSLWLDASISENCAIGFGGRLSRFGFMTDARKNQFAARILEPYQVKMRSLDQPVKSLSGGNQQKIVIAREISARRPELLIASQPTRGVDVGAIEFIHKQILDLQSQGAGILLISSELEELCALSDRIIVLFEGQCVATFNGPDFDLKKIGHAMTAGTVA